MRVSTLAGGLLLAAVQLIHAAPQSGPLADALYKDASASIEDRVADLLPRMTLDEKIGQLMQGDMSNWLNINTGAYNRTALEANFVYKQGSFYVGFPIPWDWMFDNIKRGQKYLVEETRLGIPAFVQTEGIHGFLLPNATIFNSPIGFGCSFNPDLVQKAADVIGKEAAAFGVSQLFAPLSDLARELRFGRVEECNSEDAFLAAEISTALVKGFQNRKVSAMLKHFVGASGPEGGVNTAPVHGGERELRTTWLRAFKKPIVEGGATAIMSGYTSYDGIPTNADHHVLTDILRGEWGYKYYVMSDAGATDRLADAFRMCPDKTTQVGRECITKKILEAGNDVEMGGGSFNFRSIANLTKAGQLDISVVDTAVARQLTAKFAMGLFENPYASVTPSQLSRTVHTDRNVAVARELDRESIVLLENHDNTLPLSKSAKVAVIGPMAHGFMNYGDYVPFKSSLRGVTPYDGIKAAIGAENVVYAKGCERWSNDDSGFPEAIAAAESADVAVVVVGTWSRDQNELWQGLNATTGEHVDVHSLNLVGAQSKLVKAIADTKKPTIVVFSSGKPITEDWMANYTSALVQQFYPSEQGGNALADVLFGDYNPSGKLSVSFPHDVGTTPSFYDYLNSARSWPDPGKQLPDGTLVFGHNYVLNNPVPWYQFGFGRSYTTFKFANIKLSKSKVDWASAQTDATVTVIVDVTNTGERDGQEVVQVYVRDLVSSVVVPNQLLKGFKKVLIKAGETKNIRIPLEVSDFGLWGIGMKYEVERGQFEIAVGSSCIDIHGTATFEVV
ncbi:Beta-glucosidase [Dactylellina cionopaga]|nr:Beta-glucosidase [Dactylellina cionopaga]